MADKNVRWGKVISYAGAFIAFLIGSGFATGQEVLQYFSGFGTKGILGVFAITLMFLLVGADFIAVGKENNFAKGNDIYRYYCGKYIGTFYDFFSIAFIYMSYIVMIGGSGATIHQQYGLPTWVGGVAMGVLAIGTVVMGLGKIVDIIGKIGPAIVVLTIFLGVVAVIKNPSGLTTVDEILPSLVFKKAADNWFMAALSYVGFCMLWLAAFLGSLGAETKSKKEGILGTTFGAIGFGVGLLAITLGIMANMKELAGTMVPSLILAEQISPLLAIVFSAIVIAGIYTTSVPLLWQVIARFSQEKTKKFIVMTIALGIVGIIVGLWVPFDSLVNIIYVINGYVGILLLIFMVVKKFMVISAKKKMA